MGEDGGWRFQGGWARIMGWVWMSQGRRCRGPGHEGTLAWVGGHAESWPLSAPRTGLLRVRVGKGDKSVTYEEAHGPQYIAHHKGRLSLHTGEGAMVQGAPRMKFSAVAITQTPDKHVRGA